MRPLRIAIVHYHLKRGGVTRVIESTLAAAHAYSSRSKFVVLAGEVPAEISFQASAVTVPGLQYSNVLSETAEPNLLLSQLKAAAHAALGAVPDLWHIHNHSLGKNSSIPEVVRLLASEGTPLLLQMHDFAEDGRPSNYASIAMPAQLYPAAPQLHYASINARDHSYVKSMGLPQQQIHLLPNPVDANSECAAPAQHICELRQALNAQRLILYPVRAVRRKNFGELLLWSAMAQAGDIFATTLGPTNHNYAAAYKNWQQLATELRLPVCFGIGESKKWSFETIMGSADTILNTSIAEGFGLAFLEPWLYGKAIIGRDLPTITGDFKTHGLELAALYPALGIPAKWIDLNALESQIADGLKSTYATYGLKLPQHASQRALQAITLSDGSIDFGGLAETQQIQIITRVAQDLGARNAIRQSLPLDLNQSARIEQNAQVVRQHFGPKRYIEQLEGIYQNLTQAAPFKSKQKIGYHNSQQLLGSFLKPENFRLLRAS